MHTLKQMLAEADSQLGRLEEGQAEDIQVVQTFIEDVPRFMQALRDGLKASATAAINQINSSLGNFTAMTNEVERDYLDALNRLQARMADRRAQMRDVGAIAQPMSAEDSAAELCGLKAA